MVNLPIAGQKFREAFVPRNKWVVRYLDRKALT